MDWKQIVIAVDDARENLLPLKAVLVDAGFVFHGAESGEACIAMIGRIKPHLILLDIQMPVVDGFETCRRLRTMPLMQSVPIVFLTAKKTVDDVREGMAAGGNDFIIKPFERGKLLERVKYWTTRGFRAQAPARQAAAPVDPQPAPAATPAD